MNLKKDTTRAWFVPAAMRAGPASATLRSCYTSVQPGQLPIDCGSQSFGEHTLGAGASGTWQAAASGILVLLPTAGLVRYQKVGEKEQLIEAGSVLFTPQQAGDGYTLGNPSTTNLVNVLAIHLKGTANSLLYTFDLHRHFNQLLSLPQPSTGIPCQLQLGMYAGRAEDEIALAAGDTLLAYAIEGAFEVQNRLLERGDSLLLWNTDQIAFEALSQDAILLLLTLPIQLH